MLPILGALVSPRHNAVYHLAGPASALFVPAIFNLFLLASVFTIILLMARPVHRFGVLVWSACFFSMPWIFLKNTTAMYDIHMTHRVSMSVFGLCLLCICASALLWRPAYAGRYERGLAYGRRTLGLAGVFGAILTLQMCWFFLQARHLNDPAMGAGSVFGAPFTSSGPVVTGKTRPRVVWIVFDEMSEDQVVDSREAGLELPHLDDFIAQSTVFTHAVPAGMYTEMVFPALMGGTTGTAIRASADGRTMQLHQPGNGSQQATWNTFDERKTVFAYADALGYHPAVVGWYNPYCRMLPNVLTSCFWTGESALSFLFPARTIRENLFNPAVRLLEDIPAFFLPRRLPKANQISAELHITDYLATSEAADAALADPDLDFLMLHLPLPHPGGIYDRKTGQLTTGPSTYIDNLALVDRYLGHVKAILDAQHAWDDTTMLIMGDHSWRTRLLWTYDSNWTKEEQAASHGGQFDDRPFYALKLPQQSRPVRIDRAFRADNTPALLRALLRHDLKDAGQVDAWSRSAP